MFCLKKCIVPIGLLVSCTESGCLGSIGFYSTKPIEVVVTQTESAQPVSNQEVILNYKRPSIFHGVPGEIKARTDEHGRIVIPVANLDFDMSLNASGTKVDFNSGIVQQGGVLTLQRNKSH